MCAIIQLQPGYTPPYSLIQHAAWNNPHGYGLIVKKKNKLEIIKELPPDGNDPQKIFGLLKKNEDAERFLHVRWKTQGDVSEENIHPFKVFSHKGRDIWFMHNGTLGSYGPSYVHGSNMGTNVPQPSDSKKFADTVLTPILSKVIGPNGLGDIEDPIVFQIIDKYWSYSNKGVLIATDLDPMFLGKHQWQTIKTSEIVDGEEVTGSFYASNDDYFKELKRGPVFEKLKAAREEEERQRRLANAATRPTVDSRSDLPEGVTALTCPAWSERFSLTDDIQDICEDNDLYSPEGHIAMANMTYEDVMTLVRKSPEGCATLLYYLTDFLKHATNELDKTKKKQESAEGVIAKLKHQIDALQLRNEELLKENATAGQSN